MRVGLLQIGFDTGTRSGNLQRVGAAIDEAANSVPPPDLLVLPGACDTAGGRFARGYPQAFAEAWIEAMGFKAREWGVFIAVGLHRRTPEELMPFTALLDPDGDVIARSGPGVDWSSLPADGSAATGARHLWPTPIGTLGVLARGQEIPAEAATPGAFLAYPRVSGRRPRGSSGIAAADLLKGEGANLGAYWGAVSAASDKPAADVPTSFICDAQGAVLAAADTPGETILFADLPLAGGAATDGD